MSAHSAGAYTATLLVMVNVIKGGGRAPPTLTTARTNFTLMTECTPESSGCNSVFSVVMPDDAVLSILAPFPFVVFLFVRKKYRIRGLR